MQEESDELWSEWASLETKLSKQHAHFFKLPDAERHLLPGGGPRMLEIEQTAARLFDAKDELFSRLPRLKARTPEAVIAKLAVVSHLILHDEHPEAHPIIKDSIKDLR